MSCSQVIPLIYLLNLRKRLHFYGKSEVRVLPLANADVAGVSCQSSDWLTLTTYGTEVRIERA